MSGRLSRAVVWALVTGSLLCGCEGRSASPVSEDPRTLIELPLDAREAVLLEMRTMLGSLNAVLAGLSRNDRSAMLDAASASGLAGAADTALEALLPEDFLKIGLETHQQFDRLAQTIEAGAVTDEIVSVLARLTGNCVACHAIYRLEVQ